MPEFSDRQFCATAYADGYTCPSPSRANTRAAEALWVSRGINRVLEVVAEGKWLILGGQPAGVFEEALRGMAGEG